MAQIAAMNASSTPSQTPGAKVPTSGVVKGASTDLLSEISKALEKISESLRTLK
jgi:hypothetical protein